MLASCSLFFVMIFEKNHNDIGSYLMTKWSVRTGKSIDRCVVPTIRTAPVQRSIPSCKWDAEDLHAIAKRADPRSAAYNSFDNGEMRCVRIF